METINTLKPTFTFGIVPIVAGLDKFTDLLTHWENYIHPSIVQMLPFTPQKQKKYLNSI